MANEYAKPRVPARPDEGVVMVTADLGVAEVDAVAVPDPTEFLARI